MARLRFSRAGAEAEATRLALDYVAGQPELATLTWIATVPNVGVPRSPNSKHPVDWLVVFQATVPSAHTIDGGELFVAVNLETRRVGNSERL